jgi:hypothetical protein
LLLLVCAASAFGGERPQVPHIGYIYPAGGRKGTTFEAKIGGDNLYRSTEAIVSGKGVTVQIVDAKEPPGYDEKKKNRQKKTVIDEIVTVKVTIAWEADLTPREICLLAPNGLTNKLAFQVGQAKEVREVEPNDKPEKATPIPQLPAVVNGQIMPGDVDMFSFSAKKGQHLVCEASARALIPYIADAVPGWFQSILTLYDSKGKEVALADDYRFNQDPVLFYDVPADGQYTLSIRDSIYRGREDFVYRVSIGELPFITSIAPLGSPRGDKPVAVKVFGKNLPKPSVNLDVSAVGDTGFGTRYVTVTDAQGWVSNRIPFAVSDVAEVTDEDSTKEKPLAVTMPVVVNGCIREAGEKHAYSFSGKKGQNVCLEVRARRLGSPLDSYIMLFNSKGEKIGENDDIKDKSEGLLTHVADSELVCVLPEDGTYTAQIYDTQGKGGPEYAYRFRIGPPAPDFDLRITPAAVSVPKGGCAQLAVFVIRKDGFSGEIKLSLDDASPGELSLDGGIIQEGSDRVRLTLSASDKSNVGSFAPRLRGTAMIDGKSISHIAAPAEDLMQAFIYQHLVPRREQLVMVTKPGAPFSITPKLPAGGCLELPLGQEVSFPVSVTRTKGFDGPIRVQLVDAPKGVTVSKGWIGAGKNTGYVSVQTDGTLEQKVRENLIFSGTMTLEKPNPVPAPSSSAPKPAEKKPADTTPAKPAEKAPAAPTEKTPAAADKKMEDPADLTIGKRKDATMATDDKSKPAAPPVPPPPAAKPAGPPPERITITMRAVPFKMTGEPVKPKPAAETKQQ